MSEAAFSEEASVNASRTSAKSDSSPEPVEAPVRVEADKGVKPEPVVAKPAVEAPAKAAEAEDDAAEEAPMPKDLEGFEKALKAARGDARKNRKQWRAIESEKQAIERKLAMMEGELRGLRTQPPTPAQDKPQAQDKNDPDAAFYTDGPGKFLATREQQIMAQVNARFIEADARAMKRSTPDYDQAEAAFIAAAQSDPTLAAAFQRNSDPVGFAYKTGKELLKLQELEVSSIEDFEAKIRAKAIAEYEASKANTITPPAAVSAPARPPIPPKTNASARGSGAGDTRSWSGPRSTEQIWGTGPSR